MGPKKKGGRGGKGNNTNNNSNNKKEENKSIPKEEEVSVESKEEKEELKEEEKKQVHFSEEEEEIPKEDSIQEENKENEENVEEEGKEVEEKNEESESVKVEHPAVGKDEVVLHKEEEEEKEVEEEVKEISSPHPAMGKDEVVLHKEEEEKDQESDRKEEENQLESTTKEERREEDDVSEEEVEEEFGVTKEQVHAVKVHFEEKVEEIPTSPLAASTESVEEPSVVSQDQLKEMKSLAEKAVTHEPSPVLQSDKVILEEKEEDHPKLPNKTVSIPLVPDNSEEHVSPALVNPSPKKEEVKAEEKSSKKEEKSEKKSVQFSAGKSGEWEPTGFPSEKQQQSPSPAQNKSENPYALYESEFESVSLTPEENKIWDEMYDQVQKERSLVIPKSRREILKYLMAKKFDKEKTLTVMYAYMNMRQMTLPGDIMMTDVERFLRSGAVVCPPNSRDRSGRKIIFGAPRYISNQNGTIMDRAKGLFYIMEKEIRSVESQRNGFVFIMDMRRARPNSVGRNTMKVLTDVFEDSFPAKFKQVLIVEAPWWFEIAYAISKPFLKPKLTSRISLVNLRQLQTLVDPENLLPSLGGKSSFDQNAWIDQMKALEAN